MLLDYLLPICATGCSVATLVFTLVNASKVNKCAENTTIVMQELHKVVRKIGA